MTYRIPRSGTWKGSQLLRCVIGITVVRYYFFGRYMCSLIIDELIWTGPATVSYSSTFDRLDYVTMPYIQ